MVNGPWKLKKFRGNDQGKNGSVRGLADRIKAKPPDILEPGGSTKDPNEKLINLLLYFI
jgi:hypothetical protein